MDREALLPQEVAVTGHIAEARDRITVLEWQLANLPADKGPELKPTGGPVAASTRAEKKVELEKQISAVKANMLANVGRELMDAPPDVRERGHRAMDNLLYGDRNRDGEKDLSASQARASSLRKAYRERVEDRSPEQGDRKTLDQSQRYAYRERYGQDAPEPSRTDETREERDTGNAIDLSQERAYRLRYKDEPVRASDERAQRDVGKEAREPEKE